MTQRIEAGLQPPQYPTLDSRISAPLSHDQLLSQAAEATLRPRLDNAVFLQAIQQDLSPRYELPQADFSDQRVSLLVIASGNSLKDREAQAILQRVSPPTRFDRIPEVDEDHSRNAIRDAHSKAVSAAQIASQKIESMRREARQGQLITVGVDVLNAIPTKNDEGHLVFQRVGKPKTYEEAASHMQQLVHLAQDTTADVLPYITEVATVIHNPYMPNRDGVSLRQAVVLLSPEGIQRFSDSEVYENYRQLAEEKLNAGRPTELPKRTLCDAAGGIVVEALMEMGMVKGILIQPDHISPLDLTQTATTEETYAALLDIVRGHVDERLLEDYLEKFAH